MLDVLAITGPIYVVIALGYAAVRRGWFAPADLRALGRFVATFALPALLFNALARQRVGAVVDPVYLVAYGSAGVAILAGAFAWKRRVRRVDAPRSAIVALGMSFPNLAFVGYPIIVPLLGPPGAVGVALSLVVDNLLVLPLALALAESGGGDERWHRAAGRALAGVIRNPIVVAIAAGFAVSLAGLELPRAIARTIDLVAGASTAVALFVVGGTLVGLEVRGMARDVGAIAIGKLVAHPLLVAGLLALLPPLDPALRIACIACACMPMVSIYPILAQKYRLEGLAAAALLVTTVASFLTINVFLAYAGPAP